ncbi:MAG TPA: thioesterase family protein [Candidatus Limnocylindrales bacterium]|nr:thioesterase family protein [Candidatus Limnocylindrales bacterium]
MTTPAVSTSARAGSAKRTGSPECVAGLGTLRFAFFVTVTTHPCISDSLVVDPDGNAAGRYRTHLSGDWNAPIYPSGGVTTALGLAALEAELDQPHQRLRSFSTMFVSTVGGGDIEIDVTRLRVGNRMSQLQANVRTPGSEGAGHLVTAAFGETRDGFDYAYSKPPDAGPPLDYPEPATPPAGAPTFNPSFFSNVETRRIKSFSSFETGWKGGDAEAIRWIRYRTRPKITDGRIDPIVLVPLADTMPIAIGQYHGPGYPFFHAPSVDISMRFFSDTDDEWFLTRVVSHWAGDGYASAEVTMWDSRRRLVAHAVQMMLIRFPTPEQLGIRR